MYKVIYRAYRPETFETMLGQGHIVRILKNQIDRGTVNHAYLFCGTRGTGKTTAARLLAKGLNCTSEGSKPCGSCDNCKAIKEGTFIDLIEIDAASNNGVDNIRELRESVNYPPSVGKTKVYIIDEVHMLSNSAFNALLKTLEEPPANVVFILATTEPNKLPQTILSRCMRMDFRRVNVEDLMTRMREICNEMKVNITDDAIKLIATNADGSVRDGLTLLDQCISGRDGEIDRAQVLDALGTVGEDTYIKLTNAVISKNPGEGLVLLDQIFASGADARQVLLGWLMHYRNLLMAKYVKNPEDMINMSMENIENVKRQSEVLDLAEINDGIIEISKTATDAKYSSKPRILLELCLVKLASTITSSQASAPKMMSSAPITKPKEATNMAMDDAAPTTKNSPQGEGFAREDGGNQASAKVDVTSLWSKFVDQVMTESSMYSILGGGNVLPVGIVNNEFVVSVSNPVVKTMLDKEKERFAEIIGEICGDKMYIKARISGEKEEEAVKSVTNLDDLSASLGMKIQMK